MDETWWFLASDNDAHWYLVPVAHRKEWYEWCDIPDDDERAWEPPTFAKRLGGGVSIVEFMNPRDSVTGNLT